ncbi:HAD family hydrolase [Marivita sp. S2033]|uniref:HAD family hydrolase n=1 Tax=Marivita sp. S2033 TaxID=3373187 RepID=UPI003981951F
MTRSTPPDIGAILFDKDGTLFDFAATWTVWATRLLARLAEDDEARARAMGRKIGFDVTTAQFAADSIAIAGTPNQIVSALMTELPAMSTDDLLQIVNHEASNAPMVEAVPLLPLLDRLTANGLQLGVATNDCEGPALAHLDSAGVRHKFSFIAGSDSGFGGKPQSGQMEAFCRAVNVPPARAVMVGDSTHDLVAGRNGGLWTVAVLTGIARHGELARWADVVLPDIGHLPEWLGLDRQSQA